MPTVAPTVTANLSDEKEECVIGSMVSSGNAFEKFKHFIQQSVLQLKILK